jgi:hypothetical protein
MPPSSPDMDMPSVRLSCSLLRVLARRNVLRQAATACSGLSLQSAPDAVSCAQRFHGNA